jgi:hypothetical protein
VALTDVQSTAGADYDPNGTAGNDIKVVTRTRYTDHWNCAGIGCTGPYPEPGSDVDVDFGPYPISRAITLSKAHPVLEPSRRRASRRRSRASV